MSTRPPQRLLQSIMRGGGRTGLATQALLVANLIWFLYMFMQGAGLYSPDPRLLIRFGALFEPLVYQGELWRLLSCQFVHVGLMHLGFNMYVLFALGRDLEMIYGHAPYLWIYLFSGVGGALASLAAHPITFSAGASGAIFGLAGSALAFHLRLKNPVLKTMFARWRNSLLTFIGYNAIFGFIIPGIDNFAHFGGLVSGFLMALMVAAPEGTASEAWLRLGAGVALGGIAIFAIGHLLGLPLV